MVRNLTYIATAHIDIPPNASNDMVEMFSRPSRKADILTRIHDLEDVLVIEKPGIFSRYVKIRYLNVEGYVLRKYVI